MRALKNSPSVPVSRMIAAATDALILRMQVDGNLGPPVDLLAAAAMMKVTIVRQFMVAEGTTQLGPDGLLTVFLRSNFEGSPGGRRRQRFTLAHELVHCLFHRLSGDHPRLWKETTEALCNREAARILIPDQLLSSRVGLRSQISTGETITQLSTEFDTSLQVVFRRLQSIESAVSADFAAVLFTPDRAENQRVDAKCFGSAFASAFRNDRFIEQVIENPDILKRGQADLRDFQVRTTRVSNTQVIAEFRIG